MHDLLLSFLISCLGYLSGSILFGCLIPEKIYHKNVRNYGDGTPGAYNAGIAVGVRTGVVCACLDMLKAVIPTAIALHVFHLRGYYLVFPALSPIIGHIWPCFFHLRGGKAITAGFGTLLGMLPVYWLSLIWALCILGLLPFLHKDHTLLIFCSVALFVLSATAYAPTWAMRLFVLLFAVLIASRHLPQ